MKDVETGKISKTKYKNDRKKYYLKTVLFC